MTPARLHACLATLDWTRRGLARRLGRTEGNVRQWLRGGGSMPYDVAAWLERLAQFHEGNPPPTR